MPYLLFQLPLFFDLDIAIAALLRCRVNWLGGVAELDVGVTKESEAEKSENVFESFSHRYL